MHFPQSLIAIGLFMDQKNNYLPPFFFLPSFRKRRKYHCQQKCSQDGFRKTKGLFPLLLLLLFAFCCRCCFSHLLKAFFILILVRNCGLMMMMIRFQIFKSTVVLFQKAGANPFLQTLNKRDSSRFRFLYAFLLLLLTLHSL